MTSPRASPDAQVTLRVHPKSALSAQLQRVSLIFSGTSPISEAEFVINCKSVMNLLHYSHADIVERHNIVLVCRI